MSHGTSRFPYKEKPMYHFANTSIISVYTAIKEILIAKMDEVASVEKVCLVSCGFSTKYGAAINTAKVMGIYTQYEPNALYMELNVLMHLGMSDLRKNHKPISKHL